MSIRRFHVFISQGRDGEIMVFLRDLIEYFDCNIQNFREEFLKFFKIEIFRFQQIDQMENVVL